MNEIKVKVTTLNDVDDFLNLLPTMSVLGQTLVKTYSDYMKKHPMETAKALREFGEIDELQYKEMITKIRKADIEKDFKPIESSK